MTVARPVHAHGPPLTRSAASCARPATSTRTSRSPVNRPSTCSAWLTCGTRSPPPDTACGRSPDAGLQLAPKADRTRQVGDRRLPPRALRGAGEDLQVIAVLVVIFVVEL